MKKRNATKYVFLTVLIVACIFLAGCMPQEPQTTEKLQNTLSADDLLPIDIQYLDSFGELGEVSEGLLFWYNIKHDSTSPAFHLLDESFAEDGMTAYLFCHMSGAEIPLEVQYKTQGTADLYLNISTGWRETNEEVDYREVLAIMQVDSRTVGNSFNMVNDYNMDVYLTRNSDDITVGWVDWSFLQNATDGELSEDIIAEVNHVFKPDVAFGNSVCSNPNGLHCIIRSTFESPEEMRLGSFLRHFPFRDELSDEEKKALENSDIWVFDRTIDDLPVPVKPYRAEDINRILEHHLGITLENLTKENRDEVMYFEEYETYYNFVSDYGPGVFTCTSGLKEGSKVLLYGESLCSNEVNEVMDFINSCVVLEAVDGKYLIRSHTELVQ